MFAIELLGNSTSSSTQNQTVESDDQRVISDTSSAAPVLNSFRINAKCKNHLLID